MSAGADLARAAGPDGESLVLRAQAGGLVVLADDKVVLDSAARGAERELINLALAPLRDRNDVNVLLAGLGMGHTLRALLDDGRVTRVDVVEHSAALVEWNRTHLAALHREPPLADRRAVVHESDLASFLRAISYDPSVVYPPSLVAAPAEGAELPPNHMGFLAVVLDLDGGPGALSRAGNAPLYTEEGLQALEEALRPGGVLALWASQREPELLLRLRGRFQNVAEIAVPVDLPGRNLDFIYRCRRSPPPRTTGARALA